MITKIQSFNIYTPYFTAKSDNNSKRTAVSKKPFSEDTLAVLANMWAQQELIYEGDSLIALPKNQLLQVAKADKNVARDLSQLDLSDSGFAVTVLEETGQINTKAIRYFDPKVITILKLLDNIKNGKIYIAPVCAKYPE